MLSFLLETSNAPVVFVVFVSGESDFYIFARLNDVIHMRREELRQSVCYTCIKIYDTVCASVSV